MPAHATTRAGNKVSRSHPHLDVKSMLARAGQVA